MIMYLESSHPKVILLSNPVDFFLHSEKEYLFSVQIFGILIRSNTRNAEQA